MDKNNTAVVSGNDKVAVPVLIRITVAIVISLYGSLTQVGMNPAQDFGPRIFAVSELRLATDLQALQG